MSFRRRRKARSLKRLNYGLSENDPIIIARLHLCISGVFGSLRP